MESGMAGWQPEDWSSYEERNGLGCRDPAAPTNPSALAALIRSFAAVTAGYATPAWHAEAPSWYNDVTFLNEREIGVGGEYLKVSGFRSDADEVARHARSLPEALGEQAAELVSLGDSRFSRDAVADALFPIAAEEVVTFMRVEDGGVDRCFLAVGHSNRGLEVAYEATPEGLLL
jgi:hypothetical protein